MSVRQIGTTACESASRKRKKKKKEVRAVQHPMAVCLLEPGRFAVSPNGSESQLHSPILFALRSAMWIMYAYTEEEEEEEEEEEKKNIVARKASVDCWAAWAAVRNYKCTRQGDAPCPLLCCTFSSIKSSVEICKIHSLSTYRGFFSKEANEYWIESPPNWEASSRLYVQLR